MAARTGPVAGQVIAPLPLLVAGCLPFWAGSLLSEVSGYPLRPGVLLGGTLGVVALVLAAFAGRESFAPGAGRYPAWRLDLFRGTQGLAYACLGTAALLGLLLQFCYHTGDLTIPLGALGILGGYFSFPGPSAGTGGVWGKSPAPCASGCCRWPPGFICNAATW